MPNINKNIVMQAGAAVANATNKAAGLSASTPEPGAIISAIQLVNGGRTIGPDALAHFTESVRNKLLSLLVSMEPIQSGSGTPSPDNVRPISGRTGLSIYVSPTPNAADANTYAVDWTSEAGTVYHGTDDPVAGQLISDYAIVDLGTLNWVYESANTRFYSYDFPSMKAQTENRKTKGWCSAYPVISDGRSAANVPNNAVYFGYYQGLSDKVIYIKTTDYTDPAVFKTALSGVQLCYPLATPLTYQLTGTDIVTLVGDNYIWSDSGDVTITE